MNPFVWEILRWVNVAAAVLVVAMLTATTYSRWHTTDPRIRRPLPWIIATYVVIAYGSGEIATSGQYINPGLRVAMLCVILLGLLTTLAYSFILEKEDSP